MLLDLLSLILPDLVRATGGVLWSEKQITRTGFGTIRLRVAVAGTGRLHATGAARLAPDVSARLATITTTGETRLRSTTSAELVAITATGTARVRSTPAARLTRITASGNHQVRAAVTAEDPTEEDLLLALGLL